MFIPIGDNSTTMASNISVPLVPVIISSSLGNETNKSSPSKINCAKECPCGVPTIPVPDQWLEVMVSGGFKVWHIIFIIIALIVTIVVVYCCFHRCRIPRTKQEIEADLMRSNMTNKFRDYLQELPNEPVTFIEVLKRVIEMEEKLERDDAIPSRDGNAGMRKRMGWLKLKAKNTPAQQEDVETGLGQPEAIDNAVAQDAPPSDEPTTTTTNLGARDKTLTEPEQQAINKQEPNKEASETNITTKAPRASLDVGAAAKIAKERHRAKQSESRKKRSPERVGTESPNSTKQQTSNNKQSPSQLSDDKQASKQKRKHNKPNLSRSKMVREKTHPSFEAGNTTPTIANGHSDEPKLEVPVAVHEQTQVTFEEPKLSTKETGSKKKATKKKQSTSAKKTTPVKKIVAKDKTTKGKDS